MAGRTAFPRLFMLEDELRLAAMEAEARWVRELVEDLAAGRLTRDHDSLSALAGQAAQLGGVGEAWRNATMA